MHSCSIAISLTTLQRSVSNVRSASDIWKRSALLPDEAQTAAPRTEKYGKGQWHWLTEPLKALKMHASPPGGVAYSEVERLLLPHMWHPHIPSYQSFAKACTESGASPSYIHKHAVKATRMLLYSLEKKQSWNESIKFLPFVTYVMQECINVKIQQDIRKADPEITHCRWEEKLDSRRAK